MAHKRKVYYKDNVAFLRAKVDSYPYRVYLPTYRKTQLSPVHVDKAFINVHILAVPIGDKVCWGFESQAELDRFLHYKPRGWAQPILHYVIDGSDIEKLLGV